MGNLVYSTDGGRQCPACRQPKSDCRCDSKRRAAAKGAIPATPANPGDGVVRLHLERKGRKGKGVTLIRGLPPEQEPMLKLAKQLKSACGVGGAVKDGVIELQSIDRDKIRALLEAQGHRVKLAGG